MFKDLFHSRNTIRWTPDDDTFPMRHEHAGHKALATLAIFFYCVFFLFGVAIIVLISILLYRQVGTHPPEQLIFFGILTAGVGLALLVGGFVVLTHILKFLLSRWVVSIDGKNVEFCGVVWPKRVAWKEPLSKYVGLVRHIFGTDNASCRIYLRHSDDRSKDTDLFLCNETSSEAMKILSESWERYSRKMGLPKLEETAAGLEAAGSGSVEILSRSLSGASRRLLKSTKLLRVTDDEGRLEADHRYSPGRLPSFLLLLPFGLGPFIAVPIFGIPFWGALMVMAFGSIFLVIALMGIAETIDGHERLVVTPREIVRTYELFGHILWKETIRTKAVVEIDVKPDANIPSFMPLRISDGKKTLHFGRIRKFPAAPLQELRDCIVRGYLGKPGA